MGFARGRTIAISPLNPMAHKTTFHEVAHVLLGHTAEGEQADGKVTSRNLRECEAEAVAILCCAALDLPGVAGQSHPRTIRPESAESRRPDPEGGNAGTNRLGPNAGFHRWTVSSGRLG
jgi:hypothetical protein